MATRPSYTSTPFQDRADVSASNAGRDGSGTIVDIGGVAPAAGRLIEKIVVQATATTTAGTVRLFVHNGANYRLWREVAVTAITASASVSAFRFAEVLDVPLILPSGHKLAASSHNAETFEVWAQGADLT